MAVDGRQPSRLGEIDGLRAVALTLVVVYHLFGQGRVSGGVDVFLFVSGVVLALSFERSFARGGAPEVGKRWARAFARLAPPAALVLLAVMAMTYAILPPWQREQSLNEVMSSALYVENWQLIASQLSYGAAGPETSPVQHFWSLSIQGQLIVVIPLVVAAIFAARAWLPRPVVTIRVVVVVATISSFAYAAIFHAADPSVAYFDTFARFWEFGLGLVVGTSLARGVRLPRAGSALLGWAGLGAVLLSGVVVDGSLAYPGPLALLPVCGAALVVLSIPHGTPGPALALRSPAFGALSKVSYSLYLWHWPVLIGFLVLAERVDGVVGWRGAMAVLAMSTALAVGTWWLVERPLARRLPTLPPLASGAVAVIAITLVVAVAIIGVVAPRAAGRAGEGPSAEQTCLGAAAMDTLRPECADAFDPAAPPVQDLERLSEDDDNRQECWGSQGENPNAMCTLGPAEGYSRHLLAIGDSHNNVYLSVYEQIAEANGWRIDVAGKPRCHWTKAVRVMGKGESARECARWNEFVRGYVAATALDAIVVTNSSRATYVVPEGESLEEVRADGYASAWAERPDVDTVIIAIRDNPIFPPASLACVLDGERMKRGECALPRGEALVEDGLAEGVARDPNARLIDLTDYMCEPTRCSFVVGGVLVTRDGSHLTATFARSLEPYLNRAMRGALED